MGHPWLTLWTCLGAVRASQRIERVFGSDHAAAFSLGVASPRPRAARKRRALQVGSDVPPAWGAYDLILITTSSGTGAMAWMHRAEAKGSGNKPKAR
jgi:hypothetical protein